MTNNQKKEWAQEARKNLTTFKVFIQLWRENFIYLQEHPELVERMDSFLEELKSFDQELEDFIYSI